MSTFNIENFESINNDIKTHQNAQKLYNQVQEKNKQVQAENQHVKDFKNIFSVLNDSHASTIKESNFENGYLLDNNCKYPYNNTSNLMINTTFDECAKRTYNYGKKYFAVSSADPSQSNINCSILEESDLKKIQSQDSKTKHCLWKKTANIKPCKSITFWFAPTGQIVLRKKDVTKNTQKVIYSISKRQVL